MASTASMTESVADLISVKLFGNLITDLKWDLSGSSSISRSYQSDKLGVAKIQGAKILGKCERLPFPVFSVVPGNGEDPSGCDEFGDPGKFRMWSLPKGSNLISLQPSVGPVEAILAPAVRPRVDVNADFHFHDVSIAGTQITASLRSYLKLHQSIPWPGHDIDIVVIDRDDRFSIDFSSLPCIPVYSISVATAQICYHPNPNRICGEVVVGIDLPWPLNHWGQTFTIACVNL